MSIFFNKNEVYLSLLAAKYFIPTARKSLFIKKVGGGVKNVRPLNLCGRVSAKSELKHFYRFRIRPISRHIFGEVFMFL